MKLRRREYSLRSFVLRLEDPNSSQRKLLQTNGQRNQEATQPLCSMSGSEFEILELPNDNESSSP
jgi:hypothetical protein